MVAWVFSRGYFRLLLSGRSVVDTCILPVLLYGVENWCLSLISIQLLNSFLGELSKKLLKVMMNRCAVAHA